MTSKTKFLLLCATLCALSACAPLDRSRSLDNPDVSGKAFAQQACAMCHQANGNSTSPNFPKLAGQSKQYLVDQLTDLRDHKRKNETSAAYMWGMARLSAPQIEQLADYFSAQTVEPEPSFADANTYGQGKKLFLQGLPDKGVPACATCHGNEGEGIGPIPRIAGQHADYVMRQLIVFKTTDDRPRGAPMKFVASALTDEDMKAGALYLQSSPEKKWQLGSATTHD